MEYVVLVDEHDKPVETHTPDVNHPLFTTLAEARTRYWNIYREQVTLPQGMDLFKYTL